MENVPRSERKNGQRGRHMNYNPHKLKGVAMIAQALIPITSGIGSLVLLSTLVFDVNDLVQGPVAQLRRSVAAIGSQAEPSGDAIVSPLTPLGNLEHKLGEMRQKLKGIPEHLQLPPIPIPPIDLRLQPRVRVTDRTYYMNADRYAGISGDLAAARVSPPPTRFGWPWAMWRDDTPAPRVVRAGFLPKLKRAIPTPRVDIPTPPVPFPSPSFQVEWENRRIQLPAIPASTVLVPGLTQAKSLLSRNAALLHDLTDLVGTVPHLDALRTSLTTLIGATETVVMAISMLSGKALLLFALLAALVAPLLLRAHVIPYFSWRYEQLLTGWMFLRHGSRTAA